MHISHTEYAGNIIVTGGSSTGGVTYELISQGASINAGIYVDISGYKAAYFQGYNDPALMVIIEMVHIYLHQTPVIVSKCTMVVGGDLIDLMLTTPLHNPSTSNLYYGANVTDDDDKVWMLEILGLDQTNVFLRTTALIHILHIPIQDGLEVHLPQYLLLSLFHQALLQYIVTG